MRGNRWILGLALLGLLGCGGDSIPDASGRAAPPSDVNVLLVSLDTLRADRLSADGYTRPTSPFLDELAARGVRFPNAFVNTHGTTPSHATILTSLYQETHQVELEAERGEVPVDAIPAQARQVQELLQEAGYLTLAVTEGGRMNRKLGFARGFDVYNDAARSVSEGAQDLLALIERARPQGRPIFAFLHTYEIHAPYDPPAPHDALFGEFPAEIETTAKNLLRYENDAAGLSPEEIAFLGAQYDRGIHYTDDALRAFFERLEATGFLANALVIVTSDHGEEFGERGGLLHRDLLYEELIRVPLILTGSDVGPPGSVNPRLASSIDIAPTILRRVGLAIPPWMEGRSLLEPGDARPVVSQYRDWRYAIRTPSWKYIENTEAGSTELYDLSADPQERRNLAPSEEQRVAAFREQLAAWRSGRPSIAPEGLEQVELSDEERKRLEALGYVETK